MQEQSKYIIPILTKGLRADKELMASTLTAFASIAHRADQGNISEAELEDIKELCSVKFVQATADGFSLKARGIDQIASVEKGSVALVPVRGIILRESGFYWGYGYITGTRELESIVKRCEASPNIDGIVFQLNSPGGEASGNESLSKVVKACSKPTIVSFEMMASAAVESFIGVDEIYALERGSMFGSIGTYTSKVNDKEYWESLGIRFFDVYAKQSTEKNKEHREAMQGNIVPLQDMLTKTNQFFIDDVKKARPQIQDDGRVYAGALYNAVEARSIKAIDGIRGLDYAISRVKTLSRQQSNSKKTIIMTDGSKTVEVSKEEMGAFKKMIKKFFGDDNKTEEPQTPQKTELDLANDKIAKLEEENKKLKAAQEKATTAFKAALGEGKTINDKLQTELDGAKADLGHLKEAKVVEGHEAFASVEALVKAYNETFEHNKDLGAAPKPHTPVAPQETTSVDDDLPGKQKSYEELIKQSHGEAFRV